MFDKELEAFREQRRGSARIALDANPNFDRLTFIDQKKSHVRALESLKDEYPCRDIEVIRGDCNNIIPNELSKVNWINKRAVMFLDPYGLNVDWVTLEAIRKTNSIDVWYLVNINGILRQAARVHSAVDCHKRNRLNRMFGTDSWEYEWYRKEINPKQASLFDLYEDDRAINRSANEIVVENWVKNRLEVLFPWVSNPLRLYMDGKNVHQFSLFFAASNNSGAALGLAKKLSSYVIDMGISSQVRPK